MHYRSVPCSTFSNPFDIVGTKVLKKLLLRVILHHLIILTVRSFSDCDLIYTVVATEETTDPVLEKV